MGDRTRIFIGVACHKPHDKFMVSLSDFLRQSSLKYDIVLYEVWGKSLVDAQNNIATMFLGSESDYLLMLEDDHWGHSIEMLEDLISADKLICGIKYYSRHYPYVVMPMDNKGFENEPDKFQMNIYSPKVKYAKCGLTGFGMTLIKRELFSILDKPYFRLNTNEDGTLQSGYATDQDFCNRIRSLGHEVWGCFSHCLTHRELNDETVEMYRERNRQSSLQMQLKQLLREKKENNGKSVVGVSWNRN